MDRLTGLADRREFGASLPALSAQERISLVLFDVDDLQALNDRYGQAEVDRLLARLGSLIQELVELVRWAHGLAATSSP